MLHLLTEHFISSCNYETTSLAIPLPPHVLKVFYIDISTSLHISLAF